MSRTPRSFRFGCSSRTELKEKDKINKGDLLIEFDIDLIKATGYSLESCIILTNLSKRFVLLTKGEVMFGQSDIFSIR